MGPEHVKARMDQAEDGGEQPGEAHDNDYLRACGHALFLFPILFMCVCLTPHPHRPAFLNNTTEAPKPAKKTEDVFKKKARRLSMVA